MKKQLIFSALGAIFMASCADEIEQNFTGGEPGRVEYEYLNSYAPLKDYVDRAKHPDFKLGVGTTVSDYLNKGLVYALTNSNFDEMTAGNAMKYASCVADDGSMDFQTVSDFVSAARDAGKTIYGHTLAWHSQQNNKYLNSLIKDRDMDVDPNEMEEKTDYELDCSTLTSYSWSGSPETVITEWNKDGAMVITNPELVDPWYVLQYWLVSGISLQVGQTYKLTIECKAEGEADANIRFKLGDWGSGDEKSFYVPVGGDYEEIEIELNPVIESNGLFFQHGDFVGKLYWKSMKITHSEAPSVEMEQEVGVHTYEDGPFPFYPMGSEPPIIDGCIHFVPTGDWSQFFVVEGASNTLTEGDYVVYLDLTASEAGTGVQLTMQNGWGADDQSITAAVPLEAGQNTYRLNFPGVSGGNYDIILKPQTCAATLDLRSVTVSKVVKLNTIPLTDEEKKDTLTWAMDNWITGMMNACEGYVTTWDVVNEAISGGGDDGEGNYVLQSASNVSAEDAANNFYWQDYLGSLDYVRTAVRLARERFAESGGNAADLKLFINDYNLESDWDDNKKLKSLINWINKWEADGETKIDGIGSQMHVSCYANPTTQESKKNHIVKMFELLKESGKLVKISELDMGYIDANGNSVQTADMTEEQHKEMAELYTFIITKYFEIIPVAQQYGITQWAPTDSPAGSGWRPNEPIGLWDLNYYRKHTYAGFADGLEEGSAK